SAGGARERRTATVTLPAGKPVAGAGEDFTAALGKPGVAGVPVSVRGLPGSSSAPYRWRVVAKPRKATATLTGASSRTPRLVASRPASYDVRLTLGEDGATSSDTL